MHSQLFAVVDIETTGGRPGDDRITEIAIVLHDGISEIERFSTLVNPERNIPYGITQLTGITNVMVSDAPKFYEIAKQVWLLLKDAVFVAHNVRFDYSFVRAAFKDLGFEFKRPMVCTVRLSRKAFPGFPSYSLGKLCQNLGIQIQNRHRALGDAEATAKVLAMVYAKDPNYFVKELLPEEHKLGIWPPHLDKNVLDTIPDGVSGVYYFYDAEGQVIYVGKSNDVKKRILQHFSISSKGSKASMALKAEVADLSFENTGSELIALLLESDEIKKIRPKYNMSQKRNRSIPFYGVFPYYDVFGYVNLEVRKLKEGDQPISTSDSSLKAREFLYFQVDKHQLCLSKCGLHKTGGPCFNFHIKKCMGACCGKESAEVYNARIHEAMLSFSFQNESFLLVTEGRHRNEMGVVCVEYGQYKGFGYADLSMGLKSIAELRGVVRKFPHNRDIQNILCGFVKAGHQKIYYEPDRLE